MFSLRHFSLLRQWQGFVISTWIFDALFLDWYEYYFGFSHFRLPWQRSDWRSRTNFCVFQLERLLRYFLKVLEMNHLEAFLCSQVWLACRNYPYPSLFRMLIIFQLFPWNYKPLLYCALYFKILYRSIKRLLWCVDSIFMWKCKSIARF